MADKPSPRICNCFEQSNGQESTNNCSCSKRTKRNLSGDPSVLAKGGITKKTGRTVARVNEKRRELKIVNDRLLGLEDRMRFLTERNEQMLAQLRTELLLQPVQTETPIVAQTMLRWRPPTSINKPVVIVDMNSMKLIGCNRAVCKLTGHGAEQLQNNFSLLDLKPRRFRSFWKMFYSLLAHWQVKTVVSPVYLAITDGTEKMVKRITHFESGFFWTEWEECSEVSSDIQIDGLSIPDLYNLCQDSLLEENSENTLNQAQHSLVRWLRQHTRSISW